MRCIRSALVVATVMVTASASLSTPANSSPIISHIPRQHVESSAIAAVGYSKRRHILEIEFVNRAVYRYLDVPPAVHRDLMSAGSKAQFYDFNIKGHYRSVPIRPPQKQQVPAKSPASAQGYSAAGHE